MIRRWILLALVASAVPPVLRAQTVARAGSLGGRVTGEDGHPLRGAAVELAAAGETLRRVQTDALGRFLFVALPAGRYRVTARQLGFRDGVVEDVPLGPGENRSVELRLALAPVEMESVEVVATPVRIRRSDTEFTTRIREAEIRLLPLRPDAGEVVALTPGARPGHVWGGATRQANNYQLDGITATHPGLGGGLVEPSLSWIESIAVRGLGAGAEYGNFQGGLIDVQTKRGSNRFQAALRAAVESHFLNGSNLSSTDIGGETAGRHDLQGEVRGPLVRDRLFYFLAGEWSRWDSRWVNHLPGVEGPFTPVLEERREGKFFGKLTWRPTRRAMLEASGGYLPTEVEHYGSSGYESPEATLHYRAPTSFYHLSFEHQLGELGAVLARAAGFARDEVRAPYAGEEVPGIQTYGIRAPFLAAQNAPLRYRHTPRSLSGSVQVDLGARRGAHEYRLVLGAEHNLGTFRDERLRNGGMTWRPARRASLDFADATTWPFAGASFIPTTWGGEVRLHAEVESSAAFAQASITLADRLSINPGLRWGRWTGRLNPWRGGPGFTAVRDQALDPRLGLVLDVTGRNEFVAKAHWGRYHQALLAQMFDRAAGGDVFTNEELWYYRGLTFSDPAYRPTLAERDVLAREGRFTLEERIILNETGPVDGYRQPYVDQLVLGLERSFADAVKLAAVYVSRRNRDMIALVDRNRGTNFTHFDHVRVLDLSGQPIDVNGSALQLQRLSVPNDALREYLRYVAAHWPDIPLPPGFTEADLERLDDPAFLPWSPDYVLTTAPGASRKFDQLQLTLEVSRPRWGASGSLVLTELRGNLDNVTGYDDPAGYGAGPYVRVNEAPNSFGALENSADRELKLAAWGELPWRLKGGAFWTYATGDRFSPRFTLASMGSYRFTDQRGREINFGMLDDLIGHNLFVGQRGRLSYPVRAFVDLHLEREFSPRLGDLLITLDVFNLLNAGSVTRYQTSVNRGRNFYYFLPGEFGAPRTDPNEFFKAVLGRIPPRTLRIGVEVKGLGNRE